MGTPSMWEPDGLQVALEVQTSACLSIKISVNTLWHF